ncbi:MAG: serine/threonine-protein kinase, partial [Actinomycetota bacterium]
MNSENEDIAGVVVPGFTVRRRVGEGGFAAVFEAIQDDVGATVALKVLATGVGTAQSQRRLEREYRSMGRLRDLRGIVPVYGTTATAEGLPVIVMAYMAGGSLLDRLRANGPLSVEEVLHITDVLCEALQAAHDAGIYHRDIKPENILLDRYGQPALSDFGIASVEGVQDASQTAASLSPPHAPPERFTGSG